MPTQVIAEVAKFYSQGLDLLRRSREVRLKIAALVSLVHVFGDGGSAQINFIQVLAFDKVETEALILRRIGCELALIDGNIGAEFPRVLTVKNQRNPKSYRHFHRECFLPQNERLKGVQQVLKSMPCQQAVDFSIRCEEIIVEAADMDPILMILKANIRVLMRGPSHGQRVHAIFCLENMRGVTTV